MFKETTNVDRAKRAKTALFKGYKDTAESEGLETAISDLMCDLLHLHNQIKGDDKTLTVEELFFRAENNFTEELDEEDIENFEPEGDEA